MKTILLTACTAVLAMGLQAKADTIADWAFANPPTSGTVSSANYGPVAPDVGSGTLTASHASTSTAYSSPVGNGPSQTGAGTSNALSSNNWAVGDYYQIAVSTLNLQNIGLSFDQTSSSTGPKDFTLQYSTNGTNFTTVTSYSVLSNGTPNTAWNNATRNSAFTLTDDLSSITSLDNDATIYLRFADADTTSAGNGTVGTAGTDRLDNIVVTGTEISATPEPSSWMLGGIALGLAAFLRLRRRSA